MERENWRVCETTPSRSNPQDHWDYSDMDKICACLLPEMLDYFYGSSLCGKLFTWNIFDDAVSLSNMKVGDSSIWALNWDCTRFVSPDVFFQTEYVTDEWEFVFHVTKDYDGYVFIRVA